MCILRTSINGKMRRIFFMGLLIKYKYYAIIILHIPVKRYNNSAL